VGAVKLLWRQKAPLPQETHLRQASSNADSIYQHTSCMLLATTQIQYGSMAQPTTIQRKWYVHFFAHINKLYLTGTYKGELEHRRVKRFYGRTNKQQFLGQIAKHQRRERLLQRIKQRLANKTSSDAGLPVQQPRGYQDPDELPYTKPEAHYHISASEKEFLNVTSFLSQNRDERALEVSQSEFHVPSRVPSDIFF